MLRTADRVPVIPQVTYATASWYGMSISEGLYNAEKMAEALITGYRKLDYDGIYVGWESSFNLMAEAMGCHLIKKGDNLPSVEKPIISEPKDLERVKVADPNRDGRLPMHLKALEIVRRRVGSEVPILRYVPGPFTLTCLLRGLRETMMDLLRRPDLTHSILEYSTESSLRFALEALKHGSDIIVVADPMASPDIVSPETFSCTVKPYITRILESVAKSGGIPSLHICGDTTKILEHMVETKAKILELDYPVNLRYAKSKVGKQVCLEGNIDPVNILLKGSPRQVINKCKECIQDAGTDSGFILSTGCEAPPNTPIENIRAMVHAARKYGVYRRESRI